MPGGLDALLDSLAQLPQLLDLPQVLVRLLAFFLGCMKWGAENKTLGQKISPHLASPHSP